MNWDVIQTTLEKWFLRATGVAAVVWEGQASKYPDRPYGILHMNAFRNVGTDEHRDDYDGDQEQGKEVVRTTCGHRLFTLGCKVRSRDNRPGKAAFALLEKARTSLAQMWALNMFKQAELAVVGAEGMVDLPGEFDDRQESFASMDVIMCGVVNVTDPRDQGGYINTVEVTSDMADVSGNSISNSLQWNEEQISEAG